MWIWVENFISTATLHHSLSVCQSAFGILAKRLIKLGHDWGGGNQERLHMPSTIDNSSVIAQITQEVDNLTDSGQQKDHFNLQEIKSILATDHVDRRLTTVGR